MIRQHEDPAERADDAWRCGIGDPAAVCACCAGPWHLNRARRTALHHQARWTCHWVAVTAHRGLRTGERSR